MPRLDNRTNTLQLLMQYTDTMLLYHFKVQSMNKLYMH